MDTLLATLTAARLETETDPRWASVVARDRTADGTFWYSVRTTGVYCRPSCASRLAKPENVRFHRTIADAEHAGFRACKRCKPDQPSLEKRLAATIAAICRQIDASEQTPGLSELARSAGLSVHHFHRVFKSVTGVTPREYAAARRTGRARTELRKNQTVSRAIYESGFNSGGRFYAATDGMLGMTPSNFRAGGVDTEIRFAVGQCSLGAILVASSARGICAISLGDDPQALVRELEEQFPRATLVGADRAYEEIVARVVGFVDAPAVGLDLPLDVRGTAFQQRVWHALREIPAGSTATYQQIAARIGAPKAVRAVAGACAANTLAVAIPCHRVVRTDGNDSGYRWGIDRKRRLLREEGARVGER
jgi:AraC family transcriptional regulator of adaptative response/methylated-DNA-[protein]-cysteine methyltransferase